MKAVCTRSLSLSWCLLLLLSLVAAGTGSRLPQASYSCFPYGYQQSATHCYGIVSEYTQYQAGGGPHYWGAQTNVDPVIMYTTNGFLNNEMWLADDTEQAIYCATTLPIISASACWVEVGYTFHADVRNLGTHMFWADVRPVSFDCLPICGYNEHPGPSLKSTDLAPGKKINLAIYYLGNFTWQVRANVTGGGSTLLATSSGNHMLPNDIDYGQELTGAGTSGKDASAAHANFDTNQFLNAPGARNWNYITDNPTPSGHNPPWVGWQNMPSSFYPGGQIYTCTRSTPPSNPC